MNKRMLGKTGIEVSELAFGAVEIGMPYGLNVRSQADMISERDAISLLHAALDKGINFIDTARQYGESEAIIGKAFKERRQQIVITTKCKHLHDDGEMGVQIIDSLDESLTALQTEYVDLYMLHDSKPEITQHEDILSCFRKIKLEGDIRACGVSTYTIEETKAAIDCGVWDVVQVPFNLLDQQQLPLIELAHQRGIGIVVRSVLMKGLLSNRAQKLHPQLAQVESHIGQLNSLANQLQVTLPELATRFALSYKEVSSVLVGLDKMDYLHQSVSAANGDYFRHEQLQQLQSMAYPDPGFLNLHHWHTQGWLV
jgi:aryl-alcohol dehydrogenase-like predicted oxidoreductase